MGQSRLKKRRMLAAHPRCYFCHSTEVETLDHVPSRECFINRVGPEGFEFSACRRCNNGSGQIEQAVALYVHALDFSRSDATQQIDKLIKGVANNTPELMLNLNVKTVRKRNVVKRYNLPFALSQTFAEAPVAEIPVRLSEAFHFFARRLTCALFYKEMGRLLPIDNEIATLYFHVPDRSIHDTVAKLAAMLPEMTMTNRTNTDLGRQFFYLWGSKPSENLFAFVCQFQNSLQFFGATAMERPQLTSADWRAHSLDLPSTDVLRPQ